MGHDPFVGVVTVGGGSTVVESQSLRWDVCVFSTFAVGDSGPTLGQHCLATSSTAATTTANPVYISLVFTYMI